MKEDTYRIAKRYGLKVYVVANQPKQVPRADWIIPVLVGSAFDSVDDWIDGQVKKDDIVLTNDILLAARVLKKGARAIDPRGKILTEENIGDAVAGRELMYELRQMGALDLGPKKMGKSHRSSFLSGLDLRLSIRCGKRVVEADADSGPFRLIGRHLVTQPAIEENKTAGLGSHALV